MNYDDELRAKFHPGDIPTSQVLEASADKIEGNLTQGSWETKSGKVCLEGGILAAMNLGYCDIQNAEDDPWERGLSAFVECPAYQAVRRYLREHPEIIDLVPYYRSDERYLFRFNDGLITRFYGDEARARGVDLMDVSIGTARECREAQQAAIARAEAVICDVLRGAAKDERMREEGIS